MNETEMYTLIMNVFGMSTTMGFVFGLLLGTFGNKSWYAERQDRVS